MKVQHWVPPQLYRKVDKMAFAGSDGWFADIGMLHTRLHYGLGLISGLQQPDDPTVEDKGGRFARERDEGWEEVEAVAADLVCGLLGPGYKIVKVE